ncbi:MAG TPA: DUF6616 family protein [Polyangia bacterium]|jgi:hypothetical protein
MHLYVELWNARPEWLALPADKRGELMTKLGAAVPALVQTGIQLVGFARCDADVPHRAAYRYLAVWSMPDASLARTLEEAVEQFGWHRYFEQVNARGDVLPPAAVLGELATL